MKSVFIVSCLLCSFLKMANSLGLDEYFDKATQFNPNVPTPQSVLGYNVGDWHARPEQIAEYMYELAESSDRVWVEEIGRTWEQRPLLLVAFSAPENIRLLPKIKQNQAANRVRKLNEPTVVWMGYSVHGDEASGSNAALLMAYYLAAAQDEKVLRWLKQQVILVDPMLNPDGLSRYSSWVNSNRGIQPVTHFMDREHREGWPSGRFNHYLFDLNRDWLLGQNPESVARVQSFQQWRPLVLTDFHEMGGNRTYFFQPGVPERQNPLTPEKNFQLTAKFAEGFSQAFDQMGVSYYSKEGFDDFYYGKGSTYPDIHGAIGILFEQASANGHRLSTINGELDFSTAIKNHLIMSLTTLSSVERHQKELVDYHNEFYQTVAAQIKKHPVKGYVYHADGDKVRLAEFNALLKLHGIETFPLAQDIRVNDVSFLKDHSTIVSLDQTQFYLIRTLFETQKKFKDNSFYDVSTWTLPLAFDLNYQPLDSGDYSKRLFSVKVNEPKFSFAGIDPKAVAITIDWKQMSSPSVLYQLLKEGLKVRVIKKKSRFATLNGVKEHEPGTLFIPFSIQDFSKQELQVLLDDLLLRQPFEFEQVLSGLAFNGVDIGSPSLVPLFLPKPLLIVGERMSESEVGEVWHHLDHRLKIPVTKISQRQLSKVNLNDFTHLLLVSGQYDWKEDEANAIKIWVRQGGNIVASSKAGRWLSSLDWSPVIKQEEVKEMDVGKKTYANREKNEAQKVIGGAIFEWEIDHTHPLAYGIARPKLPVFRRGTDVYDAKNDDYSLVAGFSEQPLLSGYASLDNQSKIAGSASMIAHREGKGSIVFFSDNLLFRGYWLGASRLYSNSLFFTNAFQSSSRDSQAH